MFDIMQLEQFESEPEFNQSDNTLIMKRQQIRDQTRKKWAEDMFNKSRAIHLPLSNSLIDLELPEIQQVWKQFLYTLEKEKTNLGEQLKVLSQLSKQINGINQIYLIQNNFIIYTPQLQKLDDPKQLQYLYTILVNLTDEKEFFDLDLNSIKQSVTLSIQLLQDQLPSSLNNKILMFLINLASNILDIKIQILQSGFFTAVPKIKDIDEEVLQYLLKLIRVLTTKLAQDYLGKVKQIEESLILIDWIVKLQINAINQSILETLGLIVKQCNSSIISFFSKTKLIEFLINFLGSEEFENFYLSLTQLKEICLLQNKEILELILKSGIVKYIYNLISHQFQKVRTASLRILVVFCNMSIEQVQLLLTDQVIKKLYEHMIVDKAINKQLSLQSIIHALNHGHEKFYGRFLELGLIRQLASLIQSIEASLLIPTIQCVYLLIFFSHQYSHDYDTAQLMDMINAHNIITVIENLQYSLNEDVSKRAIGFFEDCRDIK